MKLPLRVEYRRLCPEWHERSLPVVVDADGQLICTPEQFVGHPGEYDSLADEIVRTVVAAFNDDL